MHLFLDFDGVLHPVGSGEKDHFCRLPLLERFLLREAPGWCVVVSSSWRECFSLDEIKARFDPGLRARIVGCTPGSDDRSMFATWGGQASRYPREIEIRHYLARHGLSGEDWVALDDHAEWFRDASSNGHLVITNPATGLTDDTVACLRKIKVHGLDGARTLTALASQ